MPFCHDLRQRLREKLPRVDRVLPWLIKPGVIDGIAVWCHALFRPAEYYGDLLSILAPTLVTKTALPELLADGSIVEQIAEKLRANPGSRS